MTSRTLTLGERAYPVVLPNPRDARLHVAAVIITIHVLGQLGLNFHVSVPQILAAILASALIEVAVTFHRGQELVWPASAMLTGSGVALILRVPGTPADDPWSTHKWYLFAAVAALSLATKYVIRYRGAHLFNPSNIGLVVAFLVLGSSRAEPLDFWWAPLNAWMIAAYAVILLGGLLITARLQLLAMAATFWLALAAGVGVLAASGHCMTARWAFAPVCDLDFWRIIVISPEVLIFLFFMITDPKTVPAGRVGRVIFGLAVALVSTLLMAWQTDEFGTKVALLAGLVVVCAARPVLDRVLPAPRTAADQLGRFAARLTTGGDRRPGLGSAVVRVGAIAVAVLFVGGGIVAAGAPARGLVLPDASEVLGRASQQVDPATLPSITVAQDVSDWNHEIAGAGVEQIVLTLAENLELERQALLEKDPALLEAVSHGDRLDELRERIDEAVSTGRTGVDRYQIEDVHVVLIVPFGQQVALSLGLESRGMVTHETYAEDGSLQERASSPFAATFVMRQVTGGRWLNVAVLPPGSGD